MYVYVCLLCNLLTPDKQTPKNSRWSGVFVLERDGMQEMREGIKHLMTGPAGNMEFCFLSKESLLKVSEKSGKFILWLPQIVLLDVFV